MSYQRLSSKGTPCSYIFRTNDGLEVWFAKGETTKEIKEGYPAQIIFPNECTETAENLFYALYDHLVASGKKIDFHKKTGELKIRKSRKGHQNA